MRQEKYSQLQGTLAHSTINIKLKKRELKTDPLVLAVAHLNGGTVLFEHVEGALLPWGAFVTFGLGGIDPLPSGLIENREAESVFINIGFHETDALLVKQLESFLDKLVVFCGSLRS